MPVDFRNKVAVKVINKFGFDLVKSDDPNVVIRATVRDDVMNMDNKDMAHDRVIVVGFLKPLAITVKNITFTQSRPDKVDRGLRIGKQVEDDGYILYHEANEV